MDNWENISGDEEIHRKTEELEIPNETTLRAFAEDRATMPTFQTVDDLLKDLLE